jgi:hypothetical protein
LNLKRHQQANSNSKDSKSNSNQQPTKSIHSIISDEEINNAIRKLKKNKANGSDLLSNNIIKLLPKDVIIQIKHLFNHCIQIQETPNNGKNQLQFYYSRKETQRKLQIIVPLHSCKALLNFTNQSSKIDE